MALEYLCSTIEDITRPSTESLKDFEKGWFDTPPGCSLLMHILDSAIESRMLSSARAAIRIIDRRATDVLNSLPSLSELYSLNLENYEKELDDELKIILQKNDRRVDNYQDGFLRYFGKVGIKAIEANMPDIAHMATFYLSEQLSKIIEKIPEEIYQERLVRHLWWAFDEIVKSSCEKRVHGAVSLGALSYGLSKIVHKKIAIMIAEQMSKQVLSLSKVGLLDHSLVVDVAVTSTIQVN